MLYAQRSKARRATLQALYQWLLTGQPITEIEHQFLTEQEMEKVDIAYFQELLQQIPLHFDELAKTLEPFLDRKIEDVDPIERAALLIGSYELIHHSEMPFKIAINEAVNLTKKFGAEQGHKYVNGILDQVAQQIVAP